MSDKTIRIQLDTQEETPENIAELFKLHQVYCWIALNPTQIEGSDVPDIKIKGKKNKTNSQRLRAVIYRLWEQEHQPGEFEHYYTVYMDKLIQNIINQLEP